MQRLNRKAYNTNVIKIFQLMNLSRTIIMQQTIFYITHNLTEYEFYQVKKQKGAPG